MTEEQQVNGIQVKHADGVVQVIMHIGDGENTLAAAASLTPEGGLALAQALVYAVGHATGELGDVEE